MSTSQSHLPSVASLKRQAQLLLRAVRAGDPQALARVEAHLPGRGGEPFPLAHALTVVAREHGFRSWPRLVARAQAETTRPARQWPPVAEVAALILERAAGDDLPAFVAALMQAGGRHRGEAIRDRIAADPQAWSAVIDALIRGLDHRKAPIRYECAHALDTYADERAHQALRRLLDDPVPRVRRIAMHSLACDECKVTPRGGDPELANRIAEHALHDPSIQVRRHAVVALGLCNAPQAEQVLERIIATEQDIPLRRNAKAMLKRLRQAG